MEQGSAADCQFVVLGGVPQWWLRGSVVADGMSAVRTYPRSIAPCQSCLRGSPQVCACRCVSCTRPLRIFAHMHHVGRHWRTQCAFCEWKISNRELALLDAFHLWPPSFDNSLRSLVVGFLCLEGQPAKVQFRGRRMVLDTPHLRCIRKTALGRCWHSIFLSGYRSACAVLQGNYWYAEGVRVRGPHVYVVGERAAWPALAILCRNPLWLLVASCCPAASQWRRPVSGRPISLLLAFLGATSGDAGPGSVSLRLGTRDVALCSTRVALQ